VIRGEKKEGTSFEKLLQKGGGGVARDSFAVPQQDFPSPKFEECFTQLSTKGGRGGNDVLARKEQKALLGGSEIQVLLCSSHTRKV